MKDPTVIWAAQAAEERRRLTEASDPSPEQRAEWAGDATGERAARGGGTGRTGRLSRIVARVRLVLRR